GALLESLLEDGGPLLAERQAEGGPVLGVQRGRGRAEDALDRVERAVRRNSGRRAARPWQVEGDALHRPLVEGDNRELRPPARDGGEARQDPALKLGVQAEAHLEHEEPAAPGPGSDG